jgi:hypothetical protein
MRILLIGLATFSFAAMAQTPPAAPEAAAPAPEPAKSKQICTTEKPVGSNRKIRTCRSAEQVEADRKAAQDAMTAPKGDL